jgi:hypothetical protein
MGADFFLMWTKVLRSHTYEVLPRELAEPILHDRIAKLSRGKLRAAGEQSLIEERFADETGEDYGSIDDLGTEADIEAQEARLDEFIRKYLRDALEEVFFAEYRRDRVFAEIEGVRYVFTGGTSWGDNPSEIWDQLIAIDESGITHEDVSFLERQAVIG